MGTYTATQAHQLTQDEKDAIKQQPIAEAFEDELRIESKKISGISFLTYNRDGSYNGYFFFPASRTEIHGCVEIEFEVIHQPGHFKSFSAEEVEPTQEQLFDYVKNNIDQLLKVD